jgi:hypothetical protein
MTTQGRRGSELRIGDSDREAAVSALGEHYAAGRLTKEEFDERADAAWAARTSSALWPLFDDLPRPSSPPVAPPPSPLAVAPVARGRFGPPLPPVLLALLVFVVLTHPVLLFLVLGWVLWSKNTQHGWHDPHGRQGPHRLR